VRISRALLEEIVEHARRDAPDECCGLVAARDGVALAVHRAENVAHSPYRFEVDGPTLLRLLDELEGAGQELGAIYHSHTRSGAYPSQTDINFSVGWPGIEWLIVGLDALQPEVRSFLIEGGEVREVALEVT
jgi:proteasome lid subunit RPN8/RPN11